MSYINKFGASSRPLTNMNQQTAKIISNTLGWISAGLAVASIFIALRIRNYNLAHPDAHSEWAAQLLLGFWAIIPPVWFIVEFRYLTDDSEVSRTKHSHDLSRNVWIALLLILGAIISGKLPGVS